MPDFQVTVNVTDLIPPDNFATVDAGTKTGTVYTKEQDNEWRKEVEATTQSGIKGVLKPNTPYDAVNYPYPKPWAHGDSDLYEKYDINEAGNFPSTKDANGDALEVFPQDLDSKEVQIWIKNGVAEIVKKVLPQATKNIPQFNQLNFPISNNSTEKIQCVYNNSMFQLIDGVTAQSTDLPGTSNKWQYLGEKKNASSNLIEFQDVQGAEFGRVNSKGEFDILLSEETRLNARMTDLNTSLISFQDSLGNTFSAISKKGEYIGEIKEIKSALSPAGFHVMGIELIKKKLALQSIAVGRASAVGVDDAPKVVLNGDGYTHPKVVYHKGGFAGYEYWMAITPTFGLIASQPNPALYENPHIFCSNDGINWIEPTGIKNPIDVTAPLSYTNAGYPFWSDTHLLMGDDGYMYCYYRGVNMPKSYIYPTNETTLLRTVTVCKKTRDGVNWSPREVVFENTRCISPAFFPYKTRIQCYDIVKSETDFPLPDTNMPDSTAVFRRSSLFPNKDFNVRNNEQIVKFDINYLPANNDMWHLEVDYFQGVFLMLINSGPIGADIGNSLYLAYSYDGWNFKMIKDPIYQGNSYRSCLTPIKYENGIMELNLYRADTSNGHIDLYKLYLKN